MTTGLVYYCHGNANALAPLYWHESIALNCRYVVRFSQLVLGICLYPNSLSQAKHAAEGNITWGVDGDRGVIADMRELEVWEPLSVKVQTFKTAIEVRTIHCKSIEKYMNVYVASYDGTVLFQSKVQFCLPLQTAILLLRIDDIVSGSKKSKEESGGTTEPAE